ncbi:MAG: hypothetical protein KJP04_11630, partial [Arenicella sp.]|nr:hypothetical protein [Arenicella sp.]
IVLVGDGTRPDTIESFADIYATIRSKIGGAPMVVAINKRDAEDWAVSSRTVRASVQPDWDIFETSAKDGLNVEAMFERLVDKMKDSD